MIRGFYVLFFVTFVNTRGLRHVCESCVCSGTYYNYPDNKVHGSNMGPTWVLSAPGGPHVGPMNLAIWVDCCAWYLDTMWYPERTLKRCLPCLTHHPSLLWDCRQYVLDKFPDSKVHGANMGPILSRQDPGGPHVGPMNFAIWVASTCWCVLRVLYLMEEA